MNVLNSIKYLVFIISIANTDQEYDSHGSSSSHYHLGIHNSDYDRKFIEGSLNPSEDLSNLPYDKVTQKLEEHFKRIDLDGDGKINRDELVQAVLKYYQFQDTEEAVSKMSDVDLNKDNKVQWHEYLHKVYGNTVKEIEEFRKDTSKEMAEFLRLVDEDKARFEAADIGRNGMKRGPNGGNKVNRKIGNGDGGDRKMDGSGADNSKIGGNDIEMGNGDSEMGVGGGEMGVGDGGLDVVEYGSFLHPSNYPHMRQYELKVSMDRVDQDADGFLSFDEYLGESTPGEEQRIDELQSFLSYDSNGDGKLDRDEISSWLMPDQRSLSDEEADHLMLQVDQDGDAFISLSEIHSQYNVWLNSPVTQYGAQKHHDPSEL